MLVGIVYQVIGQDDGVVGILGIGQGITQRTADALGILAGRVTGSVTQGVARRSAQEGNVDVKLTALDGIAA